MIFDLFLHQMKLKTNCIGAKEINRVLAHSEGFILAANNECINYHIQLPFLP